MPCSEKLHGKVLFLLNINMLKIFLTIEICLPQRLNDQLTRDCKIKLFICAGTAINTDYTYFFYGHIGWLKNSPPVYDKTDRADLPASLLF